MRNAWFLLEIAAGWVQSLFAVCVLSKITGHKNSGRKQTFALLSVSLPAALYHGLTSWFSVFHIADFTVFTLLVPILCTFTLSFFIAKGKLTARALWSVILPLSVALVNSIIFAVCCLLQKDSAMAYNHLAHLLTHSTARRLYLLASSLALALLYWAVCRFAERIRQVRSIRLAACAAAEAVLFGVICYLLHTAYRKYWLSTTVSLAICAGAAVIALMIFWLYYRREKRTVELLHSTNAMLAENYRQVYDEQKLHARQLHDFNHHLTALRGLSSQGKAKEAMAYIDSLLNETFREKTLCHSGNDVVDAIINRKAAEAEALGIAFHYSVGFALPPDVSPADICAVLANQIDNAVDACKALPEGEEKKIEVRIWRQTDDMVFFRVANTARDPFGENGELTSTKKDRSRPHGLGLKSIRDTAKKYNGHLENSYENGNFISIVFLCC